MKVKLGIVGNIVANAAKDAIKWHDAKGGEEDLRVVVCITRRRRQLEPA